MNFDDAVVYLSTTRSTLYKWLQAGKVPGHKLGRQWRFIESELDQFRTGNHEQTKQQAALKSLAQLLGKRAEKRKEIKMKQQTEINPCDIAEQLVWDATNSGAHGIHFQPIKDKYQISYRGSNDKETISDIDKKTFNQINQFLQEVSSPIRKENKRRFFLGRNEGEGTVGLHIRYQQLETITGPRVTLKIHRSDHPANSLKAIAKGNDLKTLEEWTSKTHGIIAVTGQPGSGKTTTLHCALHDLIKKDLLAFTIEDPVDFIIEGANQVEVDLKDPEAIEDAFNAIYDSDMDVLCLGLSSAESESVALELAKKAAASGHLVIIQMHEATTDDAFMKMKSLLGEDIEEHLIGICAQKLIPNPGGKGRKAEYQFQSFS